MLLDDDVVTDGKAEPCALSGRLGRKERVEHLHLHFGRNTSASIAKPNFPTIAKAFGRGSKSWYVFSAIRFSFALGHRVEAV